MNFIRKTGDIILTYYVNPHHFYFKYKIDEKAEKKLAEINDEIEKYVSGHIEKCRWQNYSPEIGEIVLCHYITDCVDMWIRARIDFKLQYEKEKFILWAIDYGFPIETDPVLTRPIQEDDLKVIYEGLIFKGGLFEVVPSTVEYNFIKSAEESRKTKKWSLKAVEMVEKYLHQEVNVTFKCRAYFDDHFFGSLIVQSKLVVEDFLKCSKEAVDSNNFLKEFSQLEDQPYWHRQQEDAIFKIYENNSDCLGHDNVTRAWVTNDDRLSTFEAPIDLPNLCEINEQPNTVETDIATTDIATTDIDTTDDDLIELSHQLTDSKISQSGRSSRLSYMRSCASTITTITTQQNEAKESNINVENRSISAVPLKNRLAVATQKLDERSKMTEQKTARYDEKEKHVLKMTFPAGFIVDNKAIEDKYKEDRANDNQRREFTEKKIKSRFDIAKEQEECFSVLPADRILVHSHGKIPFTRINDIRDADFPPQIHDGLKNINIQQVFRLQTIGWPGLMSGASMIFVNNALTGKTWTYLPAVCGLIIQRIQDNVVVNGCGPLAIVACASTQEVNETLDRISLLLRFTPKIRCFKAFGFSGQANIVCNLLNGAEILVTTVLCLYRLMRNELNLFTKERIISLVFDNIDLAYDRFGRQIHEIHKALCAATSNVQLIITSRTWHKLLAYFYEESSLTLCIGSYIEASVYGKTKMSIELLGQKLKFDKLISHIDNIDCRHELTIVICNTSAEVKELVREMTSMSINVWSYHDESDSLDIGSIKRQILNCVPGYFKLLICTDEVLCDLNIRCAKHIVHFSLPATWTIFGYRFSTLFDHHKNLLERKSDETATTSVVFLDENNNVQLSRLVDFMKLRGNCNIPDHVLQLAETIRMENASNIYQPFCNDLTTIGHCYGQFTCRQRHILTKFDGSRNEIPQTGFVKFDIIAIRSPVHYTVRLLEHRLSRDVPWTQLNSTADFLSFAMEMMNFFKVETNRTMHFPIALGELCAICVESGGGKIYERGKIVKIEEKKYMTVTTQYWVEVLLVDSNERTSCYSTSLMTLPDNFKNFPYQAVDIRIADIVPRDFDNEWDFSMLEQVKKWIGNENKFKYQHYCQGYVKLSIMDTLWVDSVDLIEVLQSINEEVKTTSIKKNLLTKNFCVRDTKPLELLTTLAKNAGLIKEQKLKSVDCATPTEIVDRAPTKEVSVVNKPDDDNDDLDESNPSHLNWSSSTSGYGGDVSPVVAHQNETESLASSDAHEEDLLCSSQDNWAELPTNQFHKVYLSVFYHPSRIYIRNTFYSTKYIELTQHIETFTALPENLIPLSNVALAKNCLAKIGSGYSRAKIVKIFDKPGGITAEVFFVDIGEFIILPTEELIEIPEKFITTLQFQAIFCNLIAVRPIDSARKWCDSTCDTIYDSLLAKQTHFYARPVQLGAPDKYAYGLKSRSYEVVLFDEMGHININSWIVANNFGESNPDTKHFYDIAIDKNALPLSGSSDEDSDCKESNNEPIVDHYNGNNFDHLFDDDNEFDCQFDEDEVADMLRANGIAFTQKKDQPPAIIEEIHDSNKTKTTVDELYSKTNSSINKMSPSAPGNIDIGHIDHPFQIPKVKWHQTESMIVMAVHAPDVNDYSLKATPRMLKICFVQQQKKYSAIYNLFGCIEAKYTDHYVRGLYIIIRLVKTLNKLPWPRLVQPRERDYFIEYNFEADKSQEKLVSEARPDPVRTYDETHYSSHDDDDDDEEEDSKSDVELL